MENTLHLLFLGLLSICLSGKLVEGDMNFINKSMTWAEAKQFCSKTYTGGDLPENLLDVMSSHVDDNVAVWTTRHDVVSPWIETLGCFNKTNGMILPWKTLKHDQGPVQGLLQCNTPIIAINTTHCLCLENISSVTAYLRSVAVVPECNMSCPGGQEFEKCGSYNFYTVYRIITDVTMPRRPQTECLSGTCRNKSMTYTADNCTTTRPGYCFPANSLTTNYNWSSSFLQCWQTYNQTFVNLGKLKENCSTTSSNDSIWINVYGSVVTGMSSGSTNWQQTNCELISKQNMSMRVNCSSKKAFACKYDSGDLEGFALTTGLVICIVVGSILGLLALLGLILICVLKPSSPAYQNEDTKQTLEKKHYFVESFESRTKTCRVSIISAD